MKLILCSEGFSTQEIVDTCIKFVEKPKEAIHVAVINEGYAVEKNNLRWVVDNLTSVKNNFGGNLELVNVLALESKQIQERLEKSDVIFVVGGHTDYLMSVFNTSGLSTMLPDLLQKKVYVGSSAGSMILGNRLSEKAYQKIYGERNTYGVNKYLGFVDIAIMPHLDSPHFPNREENLKQAVKDHTGIVYGLKDDSAILVEDKKITTIGSKPLILHKNT